MNKRVRFLVGGDKKSWVDRVLSRRAVMHSANNASNAGYNNKKIQEIKTKIYQIKILLSANANPIRTKLLLDEVQEDMRSASIHSYSGAGKLISDFQDVEVLVKSKSSEHLKTERGNQTIEYLRSKIDEAGASNKVKIEKILSSYLDILKDPRAMSSVDSIIENENAQIQYMINFVESYHEQQEFYDNLKEEGDILNSLITQARDNPEIYTSVEVEVMNKRLDLVMNQIESFEERKSSDLIQTKEKLLLSLSSQLNSIIAADEGLRKQGNFERFSELFSKRSLHNKQEILMQSTRKANLVAF